jgi:outer membrane protein OmpA-like peptidoglycan-associated protein
MKRVALLLIFSAFFLPNFAQEDLTLAEAVTRTTKSDNWFIQAGVGFNELWGEQDKLVNPLKRLKLGGELAIGKWFNPYFGTRLQGTFGGQRGFNKFQWIGNGFYTYPNDDVLNLISQEPMGTWGKYNSIGQDITFPHMVHSLDDVPSPFKEVTVLSKGEGGQWGFWQDFKASTVTIDLLANFSNLFYGHYTDRRVNLIPFAGLGLINAYNNKLTTPSWYYSVFKIGGIIDIKLTRNLAIYLEAKGFVTNPEFDGYKGTAFLEGTTSGTIGITYTFNKGYADIGKLTLDEIDNLNDRVNENRELIENHQEILERQQDLLDKLRNSTTERPVTVVESSGETMALPAYVRFTLDSYVIRPSEQEKIQKIVNYLQAQPGSKITLVGYADRNTGNPRYNLNLSKKRVDAVSSALGKLGIGSNRYDIQWKGDREQPFSENDWNRVVIVIEQK